MDQKLSDRLPIIIVFIIGIILVIDLVNVFVIGGPSFFSLIFKPGTAASGNPAAGIPSGTLENNASLNNPSNSAIFVPTTATPVPVVSYVSEVTPIVKNTDYSPVFRTLATPAVTQETDTYALIYSRNLSYLLLENPTAVAFDVKEPPMLITYHIMPMMEQDSKLAVNNTPSAKKAGATEELVNTTYVSPEAVFTITVYDRTTGREIEKDGFGADYGLFIEKTMTVREAGTYLVQFDGRYVNAQVDIQIKRDGNIV